MGTADLTGPAVYPAGHAVDAFAADDGVYRRYHAGKGELVARLMLDELTDTAHAPTFLPLPTSPVGRRVADLAFGDRQNRLNVDEIASRAATSVRTMSRLFPVETGMTFKAWLQRARIVQAMDWLARGNAIAHVSVEFGFSSTASFSSANRQITAVTPTMFLGHSI